MEGGEPLYYIFLLPNAYNGELRFFSYPVLYFSCFHLTRGSYRGGGLCHGSRAEKLTHHESQIFKFYFEALHVSHETCVSRITKNIF